MSIVVPLFPEQNAEPKKTGRDALVAALDVGSTQIACLVGELHRGKGGAPSRLRLIGHAVRAAQGVKAGVIVDPAAAEKAIRLAVDAAERMAGAQVEEVWVNLAGGRLATRTLTASLSLGGKTVEPAHLAALQGRALAGFEAGSRLVVQVTPAGYALDGGPWIADPVGLVADTLQGRLNVVSMDRGPLRNLEMTLSACQLRVAGFLPAPVAAAEAALTPDERMLGVTVLDIGAGQTGWAAFGEGMLVEAGYVPLGGQHVTQDIAAGLSTPFSEAERLKTLHGSVLPAELSGEEMLSIPVLGERGPGGWQRVPRSLLPRIIRPRMEELLEMVGEVIAHLPAAIRRRLVLTGGGAQLAGVVELAEEMFGGRARLGAVGTIAGLPPVLAAPAHATVAGLLLKATQPDAQGFSIVREAQEMMRANAGYLGRVKRWFAESF